MGREHLDRPLPVSLAELADLALDLRWMGSPMASRIWERLDAEAWERTKNPYTILLNCRQERLDEAARDETLVRDLRQWFERRRQNLKEPGWFGRLPDTPRLQRVAYFSMEFGLSEALPIYSGGLGILSGDHLKSASDLGVPLIGVGLLYQQGCFRQVLAADGGQLEAHPFNDPSSLPVTPALGPDGRWPRVRLELPGRTLLLRAWQARVGRVTLYLLDSNDPMNSPWDRGITTTIDAAEREKRLLQEIVLGIGGWALLEKLGIEVDVCHLNESHAALAVLARAVSFSQQHRVPFAVALCATRAGNVFTTHTPVEAAFERFDPAMLCSYACPFIASTGMTCQDFLCLGRRDRSNDGEPFNMSYLAVRGCGWINGVSQLHGSLSRRLFSSLFPGVPVEEVPVVAITNGVHVPTWESPVAHELWQRVCRGNDRGEPVDEMSETILPSEPGEIWEFRTRSREALVQYVRRRLTRQLNEHGAPADDVERAQNALDPNALTLGFAHRFTSYKRPNLMLHDLGRLARILNNPSCPAQLIVAGKAHLKDEQGKAMVQAFAQVTARREFRDRIVFLEDYEMGVAQNLVAGVDVWINNPKRPAEACGTSGMKILVNGGLNLSVLDGWWDEAFSPEVGWQVGEGREGAGPSHDQEESMQLLDTLEYMIVPEFYDRDDQGIPMAWVRRVLASMSQLTPRFSSTRMVREYTERLYVPAAEQFHRRASDGGRGAAELVKWHKSYQRNQKGVRFSRVRCQDAGDRWMFEVRLLLGQLPRDQVRVELYSEPLNGDAHEPIPMTLVGPIPGVVNGFRFTAEAPNSRPAAHYTPRVVPTHPDALIPLENPAILWQR